MATTITKLFPTGILQSSVAFDEVSLSAGSISFNGTTQYLTVPSNSNFTLGSIFTIEAWIYISVGSQIQGIISASDTSQWSFGLNATNKLQFRATTTSGNDITGATTLATGVWHHCAMVMEGTGASQSKLYVNGNLDGSGTIASSYTTQVGLNVASGRNVGTNTFSGNIANLRVVKGTAVYTSNFTPSQLILPAITNTVLLLNVTDSASVIKDNSLTNITLTNIAASTFSVSNPYVTGTEKIKVSTNAVCALLFDEVNLAAGTADRRTSTGTYLVSGYFDEYTLNAPAVTGSILFNATPTQWLSVPNNTAFDQTGGFTIECWFRPTSTGLGYIWAMLQHNFLTCKWTGSQFTIDKSYVGNPTGYAPAGRTYSINTWYHIAMSSNGSSGTLFINGVVEATFTDAGGTVVDGNPFYIGQYQGQGQPTPQGYISNFRVVKGTAVYTSAFTPPTTALTAITNTQLLLNTTYDANFLKDNSTNNFTVTNNGSVTSSALAPF